MGFAAPARAKLRVSLLGAGRGGPQAQTGPREQVSRVIGCVVSVWVSNVLVGWRGRRTGETPWEVRYSTVPRPPSS